jgi:hypothetical protein
MDTLLARVKTTSQMPFTFDINRSSTTGGHNINIEILDPKVADGPKSSRAVFKFSNLWVLGSLIEI